MHLSLETCRLLDVDIHYRLGARRLLPFLFLIV